MLIRSSGQRQQILNTCKTTKRRSASTERHGLHTYDCNPCLAKHSIQHMAGMMAVHAGTASVHLPVACTQNHRVACPAAFRSQRCRPQQLKRRVLSVQVQAAATQSNVKMPSWEQMQRQLVQTHKLESISPTNASQLVKSGKYVLVDVRPPNIFFKAHPEGALSAPLFQGVTWSKPNFKKYLRAVAFLANGVT